METTQNAIRTEIFTGTTGPRITERRFIYPLSWGAIIGGTIAAIGIHLLLTALAVGIGLGTWSPMTDATPVATFGAGAAIIWTLCSLIALAFGGFVAGRFSHSPHSGYVHGILVWSLTLIISLLLLSVATGLVMGGALKALSGGAQIVAAGLNDATMNIAQRGTDQLNSFVDEAVQSLPADAMPRATTRAKREIGIAVMTLFAPGNDVTSPDNRSALVKALVDNSQMSEADATKTVDAWIASYNHLKTELDDIKAAASKKASEVTDQAASHVSRAAIWSFFSLLLGLLVTAFAGSFGARRALMYGESEQITVTTPQTTITH